MLRMIALIALLSLCLPSDACGRRGRRGACQPTVSPVYASESSTPVIRTCSGTSCSR